VEQAHERAQQVLGNNRQVLDQLAQMLTEKETVDSEELQGILASNDVKMATLA